MDSNWTMIGVIAVFVGRAYGMTCPSSQGSEIAMTGPTQWSPWNACGHSCGGGIKTRSGYCMYYTVSSWPFISRRVAIFSHASCNEVCSHGKFVNHACLCPPRRTGRCCEVPICEPQCGNGGTCFEIDMCKCQPGYYGQRCELGGNFDEDLKPRLRTRVPLSDTDKLNSWYDEPDISYISRACYLKIHLQGAAQDTVIKAESALSGDMLTVFGNYTAGPIDANGGMNDSSRFSCLEVRCPGFTSNGTRINVSVNITVTSRYRMCVLKNHAQGLVLFKQHTPDRGFSLTMEEGNNYGSLFGVYTGMGFRDTANYIAKLSCFSGHRFDLSHIHPTEGVLAHYVCA